MSDDSKFQTVNYGSKHQECRSERQKRWQWMLDHDRMMTLNAELQKGQWYWMPNWGCDSERTNWEEMMALDAELKKNSGFERRTGERWWLRTPNWRKKMVALNAELEKNEGFECWTTNNGLERRIVSDDGFECRNWEAIIALNAKN